MPLYLLGTVGIMNLLRVFSDDFPLSLCSSNIRETMFKVTAPLFLALTTSNAIALSRGTSVSVSSEGGKCNEIWYSNGKEMCGSPLAPQSSTVQRALPPAPAPAKKPESSLRSGDEVATQHEERGGLDLRSIASRQPSFDALSATINGERQVGRASGTAIRGGNEGSAEPSSDEGQQRTTELWSGQAEGQVKQMAEGEQRNPGSGDEGQNQGGDVAPLQVAKEGESNMKWPPAQRVILGTVKENAQKETRKDLDDLEQEANSTQVGRTTAHKRHVMLITATLSFICVQRLLV
ncbi:expression site-associated gene (ESAG) protein, putative [Trypanosoma brucei brucei TREU927]|uniref:Expression site-associated gene (ESAG) protein, putative n=1 Tax=Trypanosoma brucei brucei (strain 927/4 GUTat10.1) TaxID=185431 RepID=Q57XG8_TRYB2|nr:expression site-associated gene (ESAG) protein, putative [Trypanosoma brucei brucei TREU927]AAX69701.1 expression site-associated gene (ESAG) protein, putative [Trypanosoma brucei]AAZ11139.1 expression site-associated gene (ESAG) protein, putative [Trypanosoma brucei brucei TREU927]